MDKNINELDRLIVGVREWAVETVMGDKWVGRNLVKEAQKTENTSAIVETATKLEEYVLRGLIDIPVIVNNWSTADAGKGGLEI
jgi:hypothetical protein